MTTRPSFVPNYFERLYARDPDPWHFATSDYERRKYAATLEAFRGRQVQLAFEAGCSIGILTRELALYCKSLVAVDVAEIALAKARHNCKDLAQVTFRRMRIPEEWPAGTFDLILFSEILYFLGPADIRRTAQRSLDSLSTEGQVLLVNWTGKTDYPCGGDEAVDHYINACEGRIIPILQRREPEYRLDLLASPS